MHSLTLALPLLLLTLSLTYLPANPRPLACNLSAFSPAECMISEGVKVAAWVIGLIVWGWGARGGGKWGRQGVLIGVVVQLAAVGMLAYSFKRLVVDLNSEILELAKEDRPRQHAFAQSHFQNATAYQRHYLTSFRDIMQGEIA
jgi:hypothetical protein